MADQIETPSAAPVPAAPAVPVDVAAALKAAVAQAAPPVAGETPQDPDVIGALTAEELGNISSLRQRTMSITTEIGSMEVRKARMLGVLSEMEEAAQRVVQGAGKRLGVPDGQQFQVLPDGRIRKVGAPPAPPAPATA